MLNCSVVAKVVVGSMLNFSVCALVGVVGVELESDVGSMLNFSFVEVTGGVVSNVGSVFSLFGSKKGSVLNFSVVSIALVGRVVGVVKVELNSGVGSMLNFLFVVSVSVAAGKVELVVGVVLCVVVEGGVVSKLLLV